MNITSNLPDYTQDLTYQEMANLCVMAGLKVKYCVLNEHIYARCNKYDTIEMSIEDIYNSWEHAGKVLGHELAHSIFERSLLTEDTHDEEKCDLLGDGLYALAKLIALNKTEKSGIEPNDNDSNQT